MPNVSSGDRSSTASGAAAQGLARQAMGLLQAAVCAHQQGQYAQAQAGYESVLRIEPCNFDALHLLGVIALQTKNFNQSLRLISRALELNPKVAVAHSNLGNVLLELGRRQDAVASYERAIALNPNYADAHYNRGVALLALGDAAGAIVSFDRVIGLLPAHAMAHFNRGVAHQELKRHAEAVADYDRAIALQATYADAHCNRGNALAALERWEEALASYDAALALLPGYAQVHCNRGNVLKQVRRYAEALASYDGALALAPDRVAAHVGRGEVCHALGRLSEALGSFERALSLQADHAAAVFHRGNVLMELQRHDEAAACFERAATLLPDDAQALISLACAYRRLGCWQEALSACERALALDPQRVAAHYNRGNLLLDRLHVDQALTSYERAVQLQADHVEAQWNASLCRLLQGDFERGWPAYECRWKRTGVAMSSRERKAPLWLGQEDVCGTTVLLHAEQGLGDTLQFCRYAPLLAQQGARVVLEAPRALIGILGSLNGVHQLVAEGDALPAFDWHCPLLSLPLAFGTRLDTIPATTPYLRAAPDKRRAWRERLREAGGPRLGLVWAGNATHGNDHHRSIALQALLPALRAGWAVFSLQKELRPGDQELLSRCEHVVHLGHDLQDFSDTAAVLEHMDLVVCVDTSVAHLGGALGVRTWVLLPYSPDWRWLLNRSDSPWYPSMRLYRQTAPQSWDGVLRQLSDDLSALHARLH